jgi:hypothetical protein
MSKLIFSPATILVRNIEGFPIFYHYGVWVAEDEVIHAQKMDGVVCTSLAQFSGNSSVQRSIYTEQVMNPEKAIERARGAIGNRWHLTEKNCEAFVLWCATGKEQPGLQVSTVRLGLNLFLPELAAKVESIEKTVKNAKRSEELKTELLKLQASRRKNDEKK